MKSAIPVIGSSAFRKLDFKTQLEIKSLELFNPDEYWSRVGGNGKSCPSGILPDFEISYPPNDPSSLADLPVSFLKKYWAGYSCIFREEWYMEDGSRGLSPLDYYDLDHGYMINTHTFNFSFLCVYPSLRNILLWLSDNVHHELTSDTLLEACKIFAYIDLTDWSEIPKRKTRFGRIESDPAQCYAMAIMMFSGCYTFDDLNGQYPLAEPCEELDYLELEEYVLLRITRLFQKRFCFPLVPAGLYRSSRFKISNWDFVDKKPSID